MTVKELYEQVAKYKFEDCPILVHSSKFAGGSYEIGKNSLYIGLADDTVVIDLDEVIV